ncbi:MAG: hypothetical protein HGA23_03910, partial [Bacteroidales bacterium]|nr:hypothetical protein [Bacteroidales bacterium]
MGILIGIGVLVIIGAVVLIVIGVRTPSTDNILERRLQDFSALDGTVNLEDLEMAQPFSERIIIPLARKMGEIATRFTPQNALQNTQKKLEL